MALRPRFGSFFVAALVFALLVYFRSPTTNHVFDEQEALLANPYVTGQLPLGEVFSRDFWGLPPERTIGSYRPLPNLVWRTLWWPELEPVTPWILHLVNILGHAAVAAGLACFARAVTGLSLVGWMTGGAFVSCALLTEAVTGVVGLADVLSGLGVVLALLALRLSLPLLPVGVFAALCLGFGGKESVVAAVPLLGLAAVATAPALHGARPLPWLRGLGALIGALCALIAYTSFRRAFFSAPLPPELTQTAPEGWAERVAHGFLVWFGQPKLPSDPINNPLIEATIAERVSGGLGVYFSGLVQLIFPWSLSGDYSFPQEAIPERLVSPASVLGALCFVAPSLCGAWLLWRARSPEADSRQAMCGLVGLGLLWIPLSYLPQSNLFVLLPTVRAERFWYLPALGSSLVLGAVAARLWSSRRALFGCVVLGLFGFQALQARAHALHYTDDLVFWRATKNASPKSAKAHLNYSLMIGARGDLEGRLAAGQRALDLAPRWAMAEIYQGDVLCRLGRMEEAWARYEAGFVQQPSSQSQIALALQCLWDRGVIEARRARLLELAEAHRGTWLAYLVSDILANGDRHRGVDPKYRPRAYDSKRRSSAPRSSAGTPNTE